MNTRFLVQHISTQLKTNVFHLTKIGDIIYEETNISITPLDFSQYLKIKDYMLSVASNNMPILAANKHLLFAIVCSSESLFLVGPIRLEQSIHFKYRVPDLGINHELISVIDFQILLQHLLLLNNLYSDKPITEEELRYTNIRATPEEGVKRLFSEIIFNNQEIGKMHNPYDQEIREFSSIRKGDIEQLKKSWSEPINGHYGILANDNLRSVKNICIVVITLASRAAIEGGVSPEIAYSLSDSYIYKIEELSDQQTIQSLCRNAEIEYTIMVQETKKQKVSTSKKNNSRIDQCKKYIFKHLHEKIQIKDIACELAVNSNYLSELFSKNEGMTIREFIMLEKIKLASNLLMYSKYSYSEISTNLGFCSQSHFGKIFKDLNKLTPRQYREMYGVREYIE